MTPLRRTIVESIRKQEEHRKSEARIKLRDILRVAKREAGDNTDGPVDRVVRQGDQHA